MDHPDGHHVCNENCLPETPFNKIDEVPKDINDFIQPIHYLLKPLCSIILKMASCSIVSKALAKSSLIIRIGFLDC
jgi:hypothetical protein